ncbi:uncharacterized protein LOC143623976 [Bidens hawaiensis]|uniref:uncharacterized protein LOC143623976 n=1 Tax=Bidens hawaiensis TaxID=980011 RepID=UPI00404A0610
MYEQCFEQLDDEDKERLKPIHAPVSSFGGEVMNPRGVISFPVTLSDGIHSRTEEVEFLVIPAASKHDIILGREAIGYFNAHSSTAHSVVGVPTRTGVAIIHVSRRCITTECSKPSKAPNQTQRTEPEKWILNKKFPDQTVVIGPVISEIVRTFLKKLLTKNTDIFSWQPADMTDFKDLNKACSKDYYPLPEIDLKVDVVAPFKFKCFLDAYKGYHQIRMAADHEDKTAFRTNQCTFCYMMMPFGLKNAGATYQRLMDVAFIWMIS